MQKMPKLSSASDSDVKGGQARKLYKLDCTKKLRMEIWQLKLESESVKLAMKARSRPWDAKTSSALSPCGKDSLISA
jgi:hypothetical protein